MPVSSFAPWRSSRLPQAITLIALVVGLPLFLRSPPWCDITLYQMAARNILKGGVHYQDIFDTNLPGFVWVMTLLYKLFGPNVIALRVVDLTVVLGIVLLLDRIAKWGGATAAGRWWAVAAAAVFYPFTVEMSHAQRDTWMMLPAVAALALRLRRATGAAEPNPPSPFPGKEGGGADSNVPSRSPGTPDVGEVSPQPEVSDHAPPPSFPGKGDGGLGSSFLEGALWGAGVWMKPHIALMALCVWLLTAWRLAADRPDRWRALAADLGGNVLGGLAVGAPGVLWMYASGVLGPFVEVFSEWNPRYMTLSRHEYPSRVVTELHWFPPWSLWLLVTVPLAALSVLDAAPWWGRARAAAGPSLKCGLPRWLWDAGAGSDARFVRGVVGGLYLVWAWQAFIVQRGFEYAHVPETFLMVCLWAMHRWAWVPVVFVWLAVTSSVWLFADVHPGTRAWIDGLEPLDRRDFLPRHTLADPNRLKLWPRCFRLGVPDRERYELWDALRQHPPHEASPGWAELHEVAEFLRRRGVKDREVIAWFDSPHAAYLMLDIDPPFRYMHVHTAIAISVGEDPKALLGRTWVLADERYGLRRPGHPNYRYVIGDLEWVATSTGMTGDAREVALGPPRDPPHDLLPVHNPFPKEFPFNQPTVFRTRGNRGRYVVHLVVNLDDEPGGFKQ